MAKKGLKSAFGVILLIAVAFLISGCNPKTAYEKTVDGIAKIDEEYNMGLDDYKFGMDYLWYTPRFPNPLNPEDIPAVIDEFLEIKKAAQDDKPSELLLNARIRLLEAEKFYKLSKKYPIKGSVEDGFSCNEEEISAIMETAQNLNLSVYHGRIAMENLNEMNKNYAKEAGIVDVSPHKVESINETFDELAEMSAKNRRVISYFCMNESTAEDKGLEDEFGKLKDLMKEAQPIMGKAQ